jgi:hypothetical protein
VVAHGQIKGFLDALYQDSALKNRIVLWTFVVLVLPTAVLVALGVPERPAYSTMAALLFPLQFVVYLLGQPTVQVKDTTTSAEEPRSTHPVEVGSITIREQQDELTYPMRRDEFIYGIMPEEYEQIRLHHKEVERFLEGIGREAVLSNRRLVREYLLAYIGGKQPEMKKVLFIYLTELEEYLRETLAESIRLAATDLYFGMGSMGAPKSSYLSLGQLLRFASRVAMSKQLSRQEPGPNWDGLVELRNRLLHGDLDLDKDWSTPLTTLLEYSPRLASLLSAMPHSATGDYSFTYLLPDLKRQQKQ